MSEPPLIVAAARTPVGTAGHALAGVDTASLAAPVLARLAGEIAPAEVVLGNCTGPGGDVARVAALAAGLPVRRAGADRRPAVRQRAGGGRGRGRAGAARAGLVLAGGVESASTAPWRFWPPTGRAPVRYERAPFAPARAGRPRDGAGRRPAGAGGRRHPGARRTPTPPARTRWRLDGPARRAASTPRSCRSAGRAPRRAAARRPDRRAAGPAAAGVPPRRGGTVTAGNACGINDGAAAVARRRRRDAPPARRARAAGPGHGHGRRRPATARARASCPRSRAALDRAGLRLGRPRRRSSSTRRSPGRCWPAATRSTSTPTGSASRAARWRSGTRGARRARCSSVRLFSQLVRAGRRPLRAGRDRRRRRPGRGDGGRVDAADRGSTASRHRYGAPAPHRAADVDVRLDEQPDRRDRRQRLGQVDVRADAQRAGRADDRHGDASTGLDTATSRAARSAGGSASASPTPTRRS